MKARYRRAPRSAATPASRRLLRSSAPSFTPRLVRVAPLLTFAKSTPLPKRRAAAPAPHVRSTAARQRVERVLKRLGLSTFTPSGAKHASMRKTLPPIPTSIPRQDVERATTCAVRAERKEIIFATGKGGARGKQNPHRPRSKEHC